MAAITQNNSNLILINNSDTVIPVYETYGPTGSCVNATGAQIGYIAIGERYSFAKKDGETIFREVLINVGGPNMRTGYIRTSYCPYTVGASGDYSYMDHQVKVNGARSSGDYITRVDLEGNMTTFARYITTATVQIYDQNGNPSGVLPAGTHVLSSSSIAGNQGMWLMSFEYKLLPGSTTWEPLCNGTWGWLDMISTGTVSGSMKIA